MCIRFHRDAATGRMLTADDKPAPRPVPAPGGGRFTGRGFASRSDTRRSRAHPTRRARHRMAGHVFVPFLTVCSVLAGVVAVIFGGGRSAVPGGCTMGMMAPPTPSAPTYTAGGIGSAPVPLPPAGFLTRPLPQPQPLMGRIAPPVRPVQPIEPQPQPPVIMGEIEMIMGDIACPEEPARAVEPIPAPPADNNGQG